MDDSSFYQQKPLLRKEEPQRGNFPVTIFSIALFAVTFLLFVGSDFMFLGMILAVLLIHELGHFGFMKWFKYDRVRMLFVPLMGAFVHGRKDRYSQWQQVLVILAGPVPGVIIGCVLWQLGLMYQSEWMQSFAFIFLILNVINLLPIQPLDGGRLVQALFLHHASIIPVVFSFVSSIFLVFIGVWFEEYIVLGVGVLMGFQLRSQYRIYLIRKSLREQHVEYLGTYDELSNMNYHQIKREVLANTPALRKYIDLADDPDAELIVAQEVKSLLEPVTEQNLGIFGMIIVIVCWLGSLVLPLSMLWFPVVSQLFG